MTSALALLFDVVLPWQERVSLGQRTFVPEKSTPSRSVKAAGAEVQAASGCSAAVICAQHEVQPELVTA